MSRALSLTALLVVGAVAAAVGAACQARPAQTLVVEVDKISGNLYVLRGGGGNTAAFITASGVVLVDTKVPGWGNAVLEKVKTLTSQPVTTIINTHTHFDHVGSNPEFPATIEVIAHETTAKLMREMRPVTGGPDQPKLFEGDSAPGLPKRTFTDRMTIGSGDERIDLYYFGRSHTGGDAWVVFPALGAMHSGDAFGEKVIPIIDANNGGSALEYAPTLDRAAALPNISTIITGHHQTTLTVADLKMYADFNRQFVADVQAAKMAGRSIDEIVASWQMPEHLLKNGYASAQEYEKMAGMPMSARVRENVKIVWDETK